MQGLKNKIMAMQLCFNELVNLVLRNYTAGNVGTIKIELLFALFQDMAYCIKTNEATPLSISLLCLYSSREIAVEVQDDPRIAAISSQPGQDNVSILHSDYISCTRNHLASRYQFAEEHWSLLRTIMDTRKRPQERTLLLGQRCVQDDGSLLLLLNASR